MTSDRNTRTLEVARTVHAVLAREGVEAALIGALAMAVHNYARSTEDADLAVAVPPARLRELARALEAADLQVELSESDGQDPLGGVLTIRGDDSDPVQVVNFDNSPAGGHPALAKSALTSARDAGLRLPVVDLPHLIAFKLYAGGGRSLADVLELLDRNPKLDRGALQTLCQRLGLADELAKVLSAG